MRVRGNVSPSVLSVDKYSPLDGYVEVRIRENIHEITEVDTQTEQEYRLFEYDEYTFVVRDKEGLSGEINANFEDWLITGRTLEVNENASIVQDMKQALEIMGVSEYGTGVH